MDKEKTVSTSVKALIVVLIALCVVLECVFLVWTYNQKQQQAYSAAASKGEEVIGSIQLELNRCKDTTELLEDLYLVYGDSFLNDFDTVCAGLAEDNLAIGSMYFAPNAVIKYSYPDKVGAATSNFDSTKDPVQGPKARLARDSGLATIAGPHELVEGGYGFIIRNPVMKDGKFVGFTIMCIDEAVFLSQVSDNLGSSVDSYNYAVWKTEDSTAVVDDNGYIFSNGTVTSKDVTLEFGAPNDTWYLAIEPEGGWNILGSMVPEILISLLVVILIIVAAGFFTMLSIRQHRLEVEMESNHVKNTFLFNMSHDIRTPMNAIIGFTGLMEKHIDDREASLDYLGKIKASSELLLSLVNNVLEVARIESGKVELEERPCNPKALIEAMADVVNEQARAKDLSFQHSDSIQHNWIMADEAKIKEIWSNLVSNAVKYTPAGGTVKIDVSELPAKEPGRILVRTVVEDNGIGMSEEFLPHIYDDFSREYTSTQSAVTGTGLGMRIVKRYVELMGGTIQVESELGQGTKFIVDIEHELAEAPKLEVVEGLEADFSALAGKRILLAEDNELNAEIATEILKEVGVEVSRAEDGEVCVRMLGESAPGFYDLVLMDIQMPNMDGYEATRVIRALEDKGKAGITILAMTANASKEDRRDAMEAGMDGFVAKPVNVSELLATIVEKLA